MVVPIGGPFDGAVPPLYGPPPPEFAGRFRKIKVCVLCLWISQVVKITTTVYSDGSGGMIKIWTSSMTQIVNAVIGIFLMNFDPCFAGVYKFLVSAFCQPCYQQGLCGGGLTCLLTWTCCNTLAVVLQILFTPDISNIYQSIQILADYQKFFPDSGDAARYPTFCLFTTSVILEILAQLLSAFHGWRAYKEITATVEFPSTLWLQDGFELGVLGALAAVDSPPPSGIAREGPPMQTDWVAGPIGESPGQALGSPGSSRSPASSNQQRERERLRADGFQAFQGQPHRLGS